MLVFTIAITFIRLVLGPPMVNRVVALDLIQFVLKAML